jgi:DNA-directed RNA polymerase subunit RPC12/RpoP
MAKNIQEETPVLAEKDSVMQEDQEIISDSPISSLEIPEVTSTTDDEEVDQPAYEHSQARYRCFSCNKNIDEQYMRKKVRCPYCGSKIVFKARTRETHVKAR